VVKNLPFKQKIQVQSLEKEMASHSSIAWETPWTEELGRLSMAWGRKESDYLAKLFHIFIFKLLLLEKLNQIFKKLIKWDKVFRA